MRKRRWTTGEKPPDSKPFQRKHPVAGAIQQHRLNVLNVRALAATFLLLLLCLGTTTTACPADSSLLHRRDGAIYAVSPVYLSPFLGAAEERGFNQVEEQKKRKDLLQAVLLQPRVQPAFEQNGVDALSGEGALNEAHHHVLTSRNAVRLSTLQFAQEKPVQLHLKPRSQNSNNGHGKHRESHHNKQVIQKGHKDDGRKGNSKHAKSSDHKKPEHHKGKHRPKQASLDTHHRIEQHDGKHHKVPAHHGQSHKSPAHVNTQHQGSHHSPPHHQQNKPSLHSDKHQSQSHKRPSHVEPHRAQSAHRKQQHHYAPPYHKEKHKPIAHHSPHHAHRPAHPNHGHKTVHKPAHRTSHHFHQSPHHHKPTHRPVHKESHYHQPPQHKAIRPTKTTPALSASGRSTTKKTAPSGIVTSQKASLGEATSSVPQGDQPQLSSQVKATQSQTSDFRSLAPTSIIRGALSLESDLLKAPATSSTARALMGNGSSQTASDAGIAHHSSQSISTSKDEPSTQQLPGASPDEKSSKAIPNVTTSGNSAPPTRPAFSSSKPANVQDTKATLNLLIPTQALRNNSGAPDAISQPAGGQQVGPSDKINGTKNGNDSSGGATSAKVGSGSPTLVDGSRKDSGIGIELDPITGEPGSAGGGSAGKDTNVKGNAGNVAARPNPETDSTSGTAEAGLVSKDGPAGKDSNAGKEAAASKDVPANNDDTALANGGKGSIGDGKVVGNAGNGQGASQESLGGIAEGKGGKPKDTGNSSSGSGASAGDNAGPGGGSSISTGTGSNISGQGNSSSGAVTIGGAKAGGQSSVSGEPSTSGSEESDNSTAGQDGQTSTAAEADSSEDSPAPAEIDLQPAQAETVKAEPLPASEAEDPLSFVPEDPPFAGKDSIRDGKAVDNAGNGQGASQESLGGIAEGKGGKPKDTGNSSSGSGASAGDNAGPGGGSSISTGTGSNTSGQGNSSSGAVTIGGAKAGGQSSVSGEPSTSGSEESDNSTAGQDGQTSTAAEADSSEDSQAPTEINLQPAQPQTVEAEPLPASEAEDPLSFVPDDPAFAEPETVLSPQPDFDVGDVSNASLPEETEGGKNAPSDGPADESGVDGDVAAVDSDPTAAAAADTDEVPPPEEPEAVLDPLVDMSALEKTEEEESEAGAGAGDDAGTDTDTAAGGKDGGAGNEGDPADPPGPDDEASMAPVAQEPELDLLPETAPEGDAQDSSVDAAVAAPDVDTDLPADEGAQPVDDGAPAEPDPEPSTPGDPPAEEPESGSTEDELEASPPEDETGAPSEDESEAQSPADAEPAPALPPATRVVPILFMAGEFTQDAAVAACPLAAITPDNEAEAFALTGGAGAWIASWNGDDYAGSCLALEAAGSIGIPAGGCDGPLGILCAGTASGPAAVAQDTAPALVPDPPDEEPTEPSADIEAEAIEVAPADEPEAAEAADAEDEAPDTGVNDEEEAEAEGAPEEEEEEDEAAADEAAADEADEAEEDETEEDEAEEEEEDEDEE